MQPTTAQPGPGSLVAERYRLLDTVGQGGMGVVWRAQDELLDRTVAVKQVHISPSLPESEREILRERVMREARAAARLHDPAAVTVYDVVSDGDSPYLVMELVDASSLAEIVRDDGPLPPARVARIGLAVLGALEAAHAAGILHRDVKPGNVMVCANGRVLLTDFGIASTEGDPSITQTGLLLGSPAYIAPERAVGGPGGPESDLWALGATLYTAVEGSPAYDAEGALATLSAVVDGRRRAPERAGPLRPVLDALLATRPEDRPSPAQTRGMLQAVAAAPDAETAVLPVPEATTRATGRPATAPRRSEDTALLSAAAPAAQTPRPASAAGPAAAPASAPAPRSTQPRTAARRRRAPAPALLGLIAVLVVAAVTAGVLAATGVFRRGGSAGSSAIPAGWEPDNESVFSLYHPPGWTRQSVPAQGSYSAYGEGPELYERVQVLPPMDPLATVKALDAQKAASQSGYHRLALLDNNASEADLQWTETDGSAGTTYELLERAYLHNNRLYTLLFFARADVWPRALPTFEAITDHFSPS